MNPKATPSFDDVAARLAHRGIFLQPMPTGSEILSAEKFEKHLDSTYGGDFEILRIHPGLVDIPSDLINWHDEPMYVVDMVGRGSECFTFFDARTGEETAGAC